MNQIKAQIIEDSVNSYGSRLTTFILDFPRVILAEANTHRQFSRNSSSSRAQPFEKMLDKARNSPFIPIKFQKDHKGMQGAEYFEGEEHWQCVQDWLNARDAAVESAKSFRHPVTKQLRNRILEPFLMHTAIVSATDFENFFALRAHEDAEIHIQDLAYKMLDEYNNSTPKSLNEGEWHIPFGGKFDEERLNKLSADTGLPIDQLKIRIATARCARVSYLNFDGKDDYEADLRLHDRLLAGKIKHASPAEHCAKAINSNKYYGNFKGFIQYRKMISGENLNDERVK